MRHGMVNRKLGRTSSHRLALFRNQLASLIEHERIVTTLPKAKELRPQIEKLVTLARTDSVHNRRQAFKLVADNELIGKLFDTLGPRFATRPGGYTRIIKLGARRGDAAERAILEFVERTPEDKKGEEAPAKGAKKAKAPKAEAAPAAEKPKRTKKAADAGDAPKGTGEEKTKLPRKKKKEE